MKDFPEFMKNESNHIDSGQQNTKDIDGYYYTANDGSQMAFWTCYTDQVSKPHQHPLMNIRSLFLVNIQQLSMKKKLF
ncbi:hypothetical protein SDC9_50023 [bioreactor metagenome]|uniref:Uncharacterized protein n=1 Tax=bioreactor metagenome TaxID=1076179 RepID=A0A644WIQ9_9ZZZZ